MSIPSIVNYCQNNFSCHKKSLSRAASFLLLGLSAAATAATLSVGPGKTYAMPCAALTIAASGDVIEIDGATYSGDVCAIYASNLTIRGVNGRPKIDAAGRYAMGKGTWVVVGNGTVIENVEMFGAKVPDRNGAAIRLDGVGLTMRGSFLHDNENGILTNNDGVSNILIENTEFGHNGYGDGYSHNLYVGAVNSLTFRYNYSHDANVGHNLKSRAKFNTINYNRFSSTPPNVLGSTASGQPSYEIDLPNAGTSYVIGNVIEQPSANQNSNILAYGEEGATNPGKDLYVINNTFLNDDSSSGNFVLVGGSVTTPVLLQNNIFAGVGTLTNQATAIDKTNYRSTSPAFVDRANYDLHPAPGAQFIDAGSPPGVSSAGVALTPTRQYVHVASSQARPMAGTIDIGAYEAGGTSGTDTTPPTLVFISPENGARVRGVVTIEVTASDNVAVSKIVLLIDGVQVATQDGATIIYNWNTRPLRGLHTLTATAYDTSNNQASKIITVSARR